MATDDNKTLPIPMWADPDSGIVPKYPYFYGKRDPSGRYEFSYSNPKELDKSSVERYEASGSFETIHSHPDKKEIRTKFNAGQSFEYTAGGSSKQVDGNVFESTSSTKHEDISGDSGKITGGKSINVSGGSQINMGKNVLTASAGDSNSIGMSTTSGESITDHVGNVYQSFEGNFVKSVIGTELKLVVGDYGIQVQDGNYDVDVSGNLRMFSEQNVTIESDTQIVIKIGSTEVIIDESNIGTLKALLS